MIRRVKELMKVKEDLDTVQLSVSEQIVVMKEFSAGIAELGAALTELTEQQKEFLSALKTDVTSIADLREDLKKEVYDFKLLKSQLQSKILKKFEEELDKELQLQMDQFKHDASTYDKMNAQLAVLVDQTASLGSELDTFRVISKSIKSEDFQLERYAKILEQGDREKLELMKRIDTLERLVSTLRKGSSGSVRRR